MTESTQGGGLVWPRGIATAFAILALFIQSVAPVAIAPPKGQPVHFAHVHHDHAVNQRADRGHPGPDHAAHGALANTADQHHPEGAECPVCKALQAAGTGITAMAPSIAADVAYSARAASKGERAAPLVRFASEHRARAPPVTA